MVRRGLWNRGILMRLDGATIGFMALVLWGFFDSPAAAIPTPGQKCAAAKQKAAGNKAAQKLSCYANATRKGVTVDSACIARAEAQFTKALARAEAPGGCVITGDASAIEAMVDSFVAAVMAAIPAVAPTPTVTPTATDTSTATPTLTPSPTATRFVDNGDGTITDTNTGLMWEKKDAAGGLHEVTTRYTWAGLCGCATGSCTGYEAYCQPNELAANACVSQTGGVWGCDQCGTGTTCNVSPEPGESGATTIWDWLVQLNATNFAGHGDWRIPFSAGGLPGVNTTIPANAPAELESIRVGLVPCGSPPCVPAVFNTGCTLGCSVTGCSCASSDDLSASSYWQNTEQAWYLSFNDGVGHTSKLYAWSVRAVRGGL